jgi:hypothetical protein
MLLPGELAARRFSCQTCPQAFGRTWLQHLQKVHRGHVVVAATDERTAKALADLPRVACLQKYYAKVSSSCTLKQPSCPVIPAQRPAPCTADRLDNKLSNTAP